LAVIAATLCAILLVLFHPVVTNASPELRVLMREGQPVCIRSAADAIDQKDGPAVVLDQPVARAVATSVSSAGLIDAQGPQLQSIEVLSPISLRVGFDEPVNHSHAMTPANYQLRGNRGSLGVTPDSVTHDGDSSYTLLWDSGEMANDATIMVRVTGVADLLGNVQGERRVAILAEGMGDDPTAGSLSAPASADSLPISITFAGSVDPTSAILQSELWYRTPDTSWTFSGEVINASAGTFQFIPPGSAPDNFGTYYFQLVAQDAAGNRSPEPTAMTGEGQDSTFFNALSITGLWRVF
jgi:hypothetical protein